MPIFGIAERVAVIPNGARPARRWSVLGPHAASHGKNRGFIFSRQVKNHADIAPVGDAASPGHPACQGIFSAQAQREQQRPRTIVCADTVVRIGEQTPEQNLAQLMSARGELIEDLALGKQFAFFKLIERPRKKEHPRNSGPIEARIELLNGGTFLRRSWRTHTREPTSKFRQSFRLWRWHKPATASPYIPACARGWRPHTASRSFA